MTRALKVLRTLLWGTVIVILAGVAVVAWLAPETTTATAHDVEWRHLDPTSAPTTTVAPERAAATTPTSTGDVVLVISRGRVITLPRTPLVDQLVLLATIRQETIR